MIINILGYGLMGKQIAALFYLGGFEVNIWNYREVVDTEFLRQLKLLKRSFSSNAEEGKVNFYTEINKLPDAITIESVIEDLDIKRSIYNSLQKNQSSYFTNSSSFSPEEIGNNVNAIHFFNPINLKLVEFFFHSSDDRDKINQILNYLNELEFEIVEVKQNRGYIGNYILFHEISSGLKLIEKYHYSYKDINKIYQKLYDGRNIFTIIDLIGIDTVHKILKNLQEIDTTIYLPICLGKALKAGALGRKNKTSIINYLEVVSE